MPDTPAVETPTAPAAPAQNNEQPVAPATPATNRPAEASPFADGTGWDDISKDKFVAQPEKPKDVQFADGKKFAEIDYRTPQTNAPENAQAEPAKQGDTSAKLPDRAKSTEPAKTGETSVGDAASGDQDYSGLLNKYGNDPKSWASAFAGMQKMVAEKDRAIKAYQSTLVTQLRDGRALSAEPGNQALPDSPVVAPNAEKSASPAAPAFDKSAEVTQILELLGDEPARGIEKLLALTEQLADQRGKAAAESYYRAEQERQAQQAAARQAEEIKSANEQAVWNRVREMKLAQARAANDQSAIAKYGNEKYQIDEADYIDVMPNIQSEIDFIIESNMLPKDGRLTPALFKRVNLLLDPPDIQKIISDTEARVRSQVLGEISNAQKANGNRVSLQPAASTPVKSNEVDFDKYAGWHPTDVQNEVFANMSDDALAAAKEKMLQRLGHGSA